MINTKFYIYLMAEMLRTYLLKKTSIETLNCNFNINFYFFLNFNKYAKVVC